MRKLTWKSAAFCLSILLWGLAGCLGPGKSTPTTFYLLKSLYSHDVKPAPIANLPDIAIGVGPVRIPTLLDRSYIVMRTPDNEIRLAEFAEWAEPLESNCSRVLAENLSVLLATDQITLFPWMKPVRNDYQVVVDITRFSGIPGRYVSLRARWAVFDENGKTLRVKQHTHLNEPVQGESLAALIQAQNRTLEVLSRQIAGAIKTLSEEKKQNP